MAAPRSLAALLAVFALSSCAEAPLSPETPPAPSPSAGPRCLSIAAWNDVHGQLGADNPTIDTGRLAAGGVVALADQLSALRATGDAVVVLDAGDDYTGPLASTMNEGAPVVEAYRLLGVDAAALGNHDFDFGPVGYDKVTAPPGVGDEAGPAGPRGALLARMSEATYPFLSANVQKKGGQATGWPGHKASTIVERSGFRVGVVGYTTEETPITTLRPNVLDLDFTTNAGARVAQAIRELRAQGADPVVLLSHASIEGELPVSLADTSPHQGEIARLVDALGPDKPDVIVAGHRHAWMLGRVRGVPIVSSDQHGVGLARIRFCKAPSKPTLEGIERRVAVATSPPLSDLGVKVASAMAAWEQKVKPIADEPVGTLPRTCEPKAPDGTAFADQVARGAVENIAAAAAPPAGVPVVGLANIGSLRAPIGPGKITFADVFTVLPFENTVAACGTTRAGLVRLVENALKQDATRERFPLGVSGVRVEVKRAPDKTLSLVSLQIEGEPKDAKPDTPVWLALSDFILFGGDKLLEGVTCKPAATSQLRIREAWRKVIEREKSCDGPSRNVVVVK
jgi:5'-nucleotidase